MVNARQVLRLLPPRWRQTAYYRYFHARAARYAALYACAPLADAPHVAMLDLIPGDVISGNIAFTGRYELALTARLKRLARDGGLLVDVGANMGYFSLLWTALAPDTTAIAFEPSPHVAARLRRNVEANGLETRITVREQAVSRTEGSAAFDPGPLQQSGWGGLSPHAGQLQVATVRLDVALANRDIAVLKIDTEGADAWVLEGAAALLASRRIGHVFYEYNPVRSSALGIAAGSAEAFLQAHGYTPQHLDGDTWYACPRNLS